MLIHPAWGQGAAVFLNCTILAEPGKFWSFVTAANGNCTGTGASLSRVVALRSVAIPIAAC